MREGKGKERGRRREICESSLHVLCSFTHERVCVSYVDVTLRVYARSRRFERLHACKIAVKAGGEGMGRMRQGCA